MRFRDLSQQAADSFWQRWKCIIRDVLEEFNYDVYHGRGIVRENSYYERLYFSLETKKECVYIFPIVGNILIFRLYRSKIEREYLQRASSTRKLDHEKLIGQIMLRVGFMQERYATAEDRIWCLQKALRLLYLKHAIDSLC